MKIWILPILLFVVTIAVVWGIMPFHDDWTYLTAPNPEFTFRLLLPSSAFWRPFDALWGAILGVYPAAFPLANKCAIALAHALNSLMVWKVLTGLRKGSFPLLGTMYFAFSNAIAAVLVNTDTINQAWSFFFGACALYVSAVRVGRGRPVMAGALAILSILCKESGVSWLAVIPLVMLWKEGDFRCFLRRVTVSSALLVTYFCFRFLLRGEVVLGDGNYYSIGFNLERVILNLLVSVIVPVSGIDSLACFCEKFILASISAVLMIVFWTLFSQFVQAVKLRYLALTSLGIAVAMSLLHCFFVEHHVAEMHFYPVVFAGAFFLGLAPIRDALRPVRILIFPCMFALFAVGWVDKLVEIYRRSEKTHALFVQLEKKNIDFSRPVWFIVEPDQTLKYRYSVFAGSSAHGLYFGQACRAFNGWHDFGWNMAYTPDQIASIPFGSQTVRIK